MPATRKRAAPSATSTAKKQKTSSASKKNQPVVKTDKLFEEGKAQVQVDSDATVWDASLTLSNVSGNNNKFYLLQVLVGEGKKKKYWSHMRWGRVGEDGTVQTNESNSLDEAKGEFEKKFKDKTGLTWSNRSDSPKAKKYTYIEKSYEADDSDSEDDAVTGGNDVQSTLDLPTQRLMELIFNENHFNAALEDIGYNKDKLPLGKLSKSTLKTGFEQLKEIASLVKHPSLAQNKYQRPRKDVIEEWTNKYYSTIPHAFGRDRPPMIDNHDLVTKEVAMLDTLTDMEVANTILKASNKSKDNSSVSRLDQQFEGLDLKELSVLDHSSTEYKELQTLLLNTSSDGHGYRYRLQDIFRVERHREAERFEKAVDKIKNRQTLLLWHGSRTANFGGILSQGLRIPQGGGGTFGSGIYMADCSSKSAAYCAAAISGGTGILMLVEAEVSEPWELYNPSWNADADAKKNNCVAVKGLGAEVPLKWKDAASISPELKGVLIPDGKLGKNKNVKSGFLAHNEYVSNNVNCLKLRYLLKVAM